MVKIVRDIPYKINQKAFLGLLGYKKGVSQITEKVKETMETAISKAKAVIKPKGTYEIFPVEVYAEGIIIKGKELRSLSMAKHCSGYSHVYLMAVTLGPEIDKLMAILPLEEAVIVDAYGSEAVEGVAESLNRAIEREGVHYGFTRFNWRFSPGYGDLPLKANLIFAEFLPLEELGIKVTDKYSLLPSKSITAIIPAGG